MPLNDYLEVDFLAVETAKSGDAIMARLGRYNAITIHVIDGGFTAMGKTIVERLDTYYGQTSVDHVVLTHPDADHALGLKHVLETCEVGTLWMNRPWLYADEIIHRFKRYTNSANLAAELKRRYNYSADLEEIANRRGIPIREAFQGNKIGEFFVMAPSRTRYLDLIVSSEKTPDEITAEKGIYEEFLAGLRTVAKAAVSLIRSVWGDENLPLKPVSAENEMSVIQYLNFEGVKVLLTGDAGRDGLREFADYAPYVGLNLPGIDKFQVPHHGSRRNVSSELLDEILGPKVSESDPRTFTAIISSAKEDTHHPKKAVLRAMRHRGGRVVWTEGGDMRIGHNAPKREGWGPLPEVPYPEDQEE